MPFVEDTPAPSERAASIWTRQPVDIVERWKARELAHHRSPQVLRPMNGNEREWPLVPYESQILDSEVLLRAIAKLTREPGWDRDLARAGRQGMTMHLGRPQR